ncbi:hypothetical protein [Phaeacidiphilus oryzae]|uniref:hypothetical protein n=1 Tax=Phaeacidiphilus oryzae TaxID=348818 RepID=UPI000689714F|nr:hypothetical protein [Phaeacidiphilus oryzae]
MRTRFRTARPLLCALAAAGAALGLAACDGGHPSAGGGAGGTTSAAPLAGAPTTAAPTTAPATAAPAATAPRTAAPTTAAPAAKAPTTAAPTTSACANLAASSAVKAAVTRDWGAQSVPRLPDIQPVPGSFYYGVCAGHLYAAARFAPTAAADASERTALQDEGSARKYFIFRGPAGWRLAGGDGFPSTGGCSIVVPAALAAAWQDCRTP